MKNLKTLSIIVFFALAIAFTSCKKEEVKIATKTQQNVLDSIQSKFTKTISNGSAGAYAIGYDFSVTTSGKIDKLGLTTPSSGTYKIILQNITTETRDSAIMTISVADTGKLIYKNITPIIVNPGTNYRITFNDLDKPQYLYSKTDGLGKAFGNIYVRWYVYKETSDASFTTLFGHSSDYTFGGVDFNFIKD